METRSNGEGPAFSRESQDSSGRERGGVTAGKVLVFGGAHVDRRGVIAGDVVAGASNPGRFREEAGGGAFNAARSLARLGHRVTMVAPRGGDTAADLVASAAEAAGVIDRPFVFLDRTTPSYTAILDSAGDLVVALADMELYRFFSPRRLKIRAIRDAFDETDLVLCDANLPEETLIAIGIACLERRLPLAAIGISPAKVIRLSPALRALSVLFLNAAEATALCGERPADPAEWPALLRPKGLASGVVSDGPRPLTAFAGQQTCRLAPPPVEDIIDVTGAGDALAAGFLAALIGGAAFTEALQSGVALSSLALKSATATPENLDPTRLKAAIALVPAPEILD